MTKRIDSLIRLAEEGVQLDDLVKRINVLQQKIIELVKVNQNVTNLEINKNNDDDIEKKVVEFFNSFERNFEKAPIIERKALIHQMIDRIVIDKENCELLFS